MKNNAIRTKERYYQHMRIKKLENIIHDFDYYNCDEEVRKLLKILHKRLNKRYNPEIDKKSKVKMLSKYNQGGRK